MIRQALYLFISTILLFACNSGNKGKDKLPKIVMLNGDSLAIVAANYLDEELNPNNASAIEMYKRALAKYELGKNEEALADIYIAVNKDAENAKLILLQARIQFDLAIYDEAKKSADLAESLGEESKELFIMKALLNAQAGKKELALNYAKNALLKAPFSGDAWFAKGKVSSITGDSLIAIDDYKNAVKFKPAMKEAYQALVSSYLKLNLVDSALVFNQKAINRFEEDISLEINKAAILEKIGAFDSALVVYDIIVGKDPSRLDIQTTMGNIYFRKANYSKAYSQYRAILDKLTSNANLYYLAGLCKEKLGEYSKAQEYYIAAKVKDPEEPKYDQAYRRAEYLMERKLSNLFLKRNKPVAVKEEEPQIKRKTFSVEPLQKKVEVKIE